MFDVWRYYQSGKRSKLVHYCITLKEAKAWCNSEHTRKAGEWFDGFTETSKANRSMPMYNNFFIPTEQA